MENYTNVVVSKYNKNIDFVYKLDGNINFFIYEKENINNKYNIPVNKGNEASVYLKYIIDFYDELSEYTFFIHDEEFAWHHSGSIIDKYNEAVSSTKLYYNVNDKCHLDVVPSCIYFNDFIQWYKLFIDKYIPLDTLPANTWSKEYRGSAQFLVHKTLIQKLPKVFYEELYNWIITTDLTTYLTGRYLEWSWHIYWEIFPELTKNDK
jgi:hypothetical protein